MAIQKLDFARGQVVNPLDGIGDDLLKYGDSLRQQEKDRLEAIRQANADKRAQEQLDLQKQQYADQQAAKAAGSKYMADLGRVLESGVVSQADQAKLAAISQNQAISPEERARQIDAMLPKMSDAYQRDTAGQLKMLQGVQASPMLDTRDKVALLGALADPLEKRLDRDTKYGYDVKLQEEANKKAIALEGLRYDHDLKKIAAEKEAQKGLWKDKTEFDREHTWMYHPETHEKKFWKDLTADERKTWIDSDTRKSLIESGKIALEQKEKAAELQMKKDKVAREFEAANDKLVADSGNPEATGKKVAEMRSLGMPENKIREALTRATGGEWGFLDPGKPDYWQSTLQDSIDAWRKSGEVKTTTDSKTDTTGAVKKDTIVPPKQEGTWKEATPQDASDLKALKDQLSYTSSPDKRSSLQRQITLLEIKLANGGSYDRVLAAPTNYETVD